MLRLLVLITPLFWALVFYLIWQRQKHRSQEEARLSATKGKKARHSKLAPVIPLFPDPPTSRKAHPNDDHHE
ncbi:hypothetical protein [Sulfobacillus thermosulfidooxidans]|uniref:hypothetical protein n=1 Tax=Sulfobacillus thermosulfidooxidans TaxID=28034 RepID=UPI0006B45558|nr:hypothetical protein [Sulfobacillus thermosulfidooxidans]